MILLLLLLIFTLVYFTLLTYSNYVCHKVTTNNQQQIQENTFKKIKIKQKQKLNDPIKVT